jgi:hypothetical protein
VQEQGRLRARAETFLTEAGTTGGTAPPTRLARTVGQTTLGTWLAGYDVDVDGRATVDDINVSISRINRQMAYRRG